MKRRLILLLILVPLVADCGPKTKPILAKFDATALTAVQEIARIEREQTTAGNLMPAQALTVRYALKPVIAFGQSATDALIAWQPGQPVPPEMLKLAAELGTFLETVVLKIPNEKARLALVIAVAVAQQAWQVAIITMQSEQQPELTPALVGGAA